MKIDPGFKSAVRDWVERALDKLDRQEARISELEKMNASLSAGHVWIDAHTQYAASEKVASYVASLHNRIKKLEMTQ